MFWNIFIGRKIYSTPLPSPKFVPLRKINPLQNVLIFTFGKLQNFYPRDEIFEFDNNSVIRCLLLKYRPIFLLAKYIRTRKNISLYFKRRHSKIYKYYQVIQRILISQSEGLNAWTQPEQISVQVHGSSCKTMWIFVPFLSVLSLILSPWPKIWWSLKGKSGQKIRYEPSLTSMRQMVLETSHFKVWNSSKMDVAIL